MKRLALALLLLTLPLLAQQTDVAPTTTAAPQTTVAPDTTVAPPPPAAPREVKLPQPVEKTLENGLRVIVVPKHDIPLVAARLLIKTGAAADPKSGVAHLTADVLTKGTKTRTAEEIARGIEALGATMSAEAQWDASSIDVSVMAKYLPKAMEFVADVARNATFAKDEFEREQAQTIDVLQVELSEPAAIAQAVAARLTFGSAPYGNRLAGTPATVKGIQREDLVAFHKARYRPDNAVLVLAGDVKPETAFQIAQSAFGSWKSAGAPAAQPAKAPAKTTPRVVIIDMPESGQSAVVVARPGIRRADPAYFPALVTNSVLGAGYSSRLNQEIRIKRGLSYGAGSSFDPRADVGPFTASAQTKHESAGEVAGIIVGELARLSQDDVPEAELTPRKATLIGGFAQSLEATSGIVNRISTLALHGLPLSEIHRYISGVQAVTAGQVRKFAASNLGPDVNIVIAGNAKAFEPALRKQFSDVEVISLGELDLASPTLRVRKAKE